MNRFHAAIYDPLLHLVEARYYGPARKELLAEATGNVLEIGAGTGANLPYYPPGTQLQLAEPSEAMRRRLLAKLQARSPEVTVLAAPAHDLPVEDASQDTIVATLVLCTVPELHATLLELRRALRPGGRLLLLEHVASPSPLGQECQRLTTPLWSRLAGGCQLQRDPRPLLAQLGFDLTELRERFFPIAPPLFHRHLLGMAVRRA